MKTLLKSVKITLVFCVFSSMFHILALWLFTRVASPNQGDVEVVTLNGKAVGAINVGQEFTEDIYFRGRPSYAGDGYNTTSSSGSNKELTDPEYLAEARFRTDTSLVHHPYLSYKDVLAEMVTASGSGLDPDITPQSTYIQVERVAQTRGVDVEEVRGIVGKTVEKPLLGIFGTKKVNVLKLNIALEETKMNRK